MNGHRLIRDGQPVARIDRRERPIHFYKCTCGHQFRGASRRQVHPDMTLHIWAIRATTPAKDKP